MKVLTDVEYRFIAERLVGDDENLLGTLLDWAEDLDEVRFHLVHKEQVPDNQLNSVTGTLHSYFTNH